MTTKKILKNYYIQEQDWIELKKISIKKDIPVSILIRNLLKEYINENRG